MTFESILDPPQWCGFDTKDAWASVCKTPQWTRGELADPLVGLGSIWRCDECGRRWLLGEHNAENPHLREIRAQRLKSTVETTYRAIERARAGLPPEDPMIIDNPAKWLPVDN